MRKRLTSRMKLHRYETMDLRSKPNWPRFMFGTVLSEENKMRRLKYLLIAFLILGLAGAGVACALASKTDNSTNATSAPINANWSPVYVDNEAETALSKADLVTELAPAVVSITTQGIGYDMFYRAVPESGAASGVIIDPEGYIVTNNHVVEDATKLTVTLSDGRSFVAVKWAGDRSGGGPDSAR